MNAKIEEIKNFYDEAVYRKLHGFIYTNTRVEYAWNTLLTILNYCNPQKILEIGCGIGEMSFRLAEKLQGTLVTGFDISEHSVTLADKLFCRKNLRYTRSDNIIDADIREDEKFDIIFLIDVFEHIPTADRDGLYQFIKKHLAQNGFLFLSCPTPQHLDFLREFVPSEIQPVDENISIADLLDLSAKCGSKLIYYKEISVWKAADYFHAIFSSGLVMQLFSDFTRVQKSEATNAGLKKVIERKSIKVIDKLLNKEDYTADIAKKKKMIKKALGQKILDKVEAYAK